MNNIKTILAALTLTFGVFSLNSCVQDDDYSNPPITCLEVTTANKTISDVYSLVGTSSMYKFSDTEDFIIDGYVISSDETGNFYKTISIQDATSDATRGIQIELDFNNVYNILPLNSKIQINLKGLAAGVVNGVVKIGADDPTTTYAIDRMPQTLANEKISAFCYQGEVPTPKVFTKFADVLKDEYINTLVTIQGVQFLSPETDITYGDTTPSNPATLNRKIVDKLGRTVDLRNSGYASWAGNKLPTGSGEITVVVSKYNSTYQLYIRDTNDVNFNDPRFGDDEGGESNGDEATNILFNGADFENWTNFTGSLNTYGLTSGLAVQGIGTGRNSSNAFHLNGTTGSTNPYVFTAKAGTLTIPNAASKITMWVKGSAAKSLSFNVYTTDGIVYFNGGEFGAENITLAKASNNQYTGAVDTNNQWILVTLNVSGLTLN